MVKRSLIPIAVVLLVVASSACYAAWTSSLLRAVDPNNPPNLLPVSLNLSPSYSLSGGVYTYTYVLTNNTAENITGFTLVFPLVVPVTGFTSITTLPGWNTTLTNTLTVNKLNWKWNGVDAAQKLLPGQSKTYGFNATWAPSDTMNVSVSSLGIHGFSGTTYGPIPEPASVVALLTGLFGLAGLRLRKRI